MNLHSLSVFVEVVRSGTMSGAAEELYLSQPAVSKTIANLEEHYGTKLFERLGNKLAITESGSQLYRHAIQLLDQAKQMERALMGKGETLRIGATLTVGSTLLTTIIKSFKEHFPQINTLIKVTNTREIEELLLNSQLDLALVEGEVKSPKLLFLPVIEDRLILACPSDHPLSGRQAVFLDELSSFPFHMREKGSGTRELFENFMMRQGYDLDIVYESTCPISIRSAMREFNLMSVLSFRLVEEGLKNGSFYAFAPETEVWERSFSIVYHRDKHLSPTLKALVSHIESYKEADFPAHLIQGKILLNSGRDLK